MNELSPISALLAASLPVPDEHPVQEREQARLRQCWQALLGEAGLNSQPLLFNSGRLVAFCESPLWGSEIRNQSRRLMLLLEKEGFRLNRVQVRVRPARAPRKRPYSSKNTVVRPQAECMRSTASRLGHGSLKDAMLKLAEKGE